jgi:hypothetical protein
LKRPTARMPVVWRQISERSRAEFGHDGQAPSDQSVLAQLISRVRSSSGSSTSSMVLSAAVVAVAVMMIALILVPARLWHHPVNDAVYRGFDPNLIYVDPRGSGSSNGLVDTSPETLRLTAVPRSEPTVDLVTSPLSFGAAMTMRIEPGSGGSSTNVGIWSPITGSGYYLNFGSSPANSVSADVIGGGVGASTLIGGHVLTETVLGTYQPGRPYHLAISLDRKRSVILTSIVALDATRVPGAVFPLPLVSTTSVDAVRFPDLFTASRPTLAVSVSGGDTIASAVVENYVVTLPSQPDSAAELVEKIDDGRAKLLTGLLSVLGGLLCLIAVAGWVRPRLVTPGRPRFPFVNRVTSVGFWPMLLLPGGVIAYIALNVSLFHLGTPHFDIYSPKIWSYIAAQYTYLDLYHRPFVIPAAGVQGGIPSHEASFPYGPTKAVYYLAVGWFYRIFLSAPGPIVADTFQLEVLLKFLNVVFALGDALLIYLIVVGFGVKPASARVSVALFALNPALVFVMSIWGSTETISLFFVLLSVYLAQRNLPTWAWIALVFGSFTRPQILVLAFLLGCAYLRTFSTRANVLGISWATVTFFVAMTPLAIGISPSVPFDYVVHILGFQVGTGQADVFSAISPGYYSVWTLPLMLVNGQHGIYRMWYPRTTHLVGSISYAQASIVAVLVFLVVVAAILLLRRSSGSMARHLPLVAFGMLGWLMLMDSLISRYFLYGLVLVIACRHAFRTGFYLWSVGWLSLVVFVSAWSHFGLDVLGYHAILNPLNPATNPVTRGVQALFFSDRLITSGTLANIFVLVFLGFYAIRGTPPPVTEAQGMLRHGGTPAGFKGDLESSSP